MFHLRQPRSGSIDPTRSTSSSLRSTLRWPATRLALLTAAFSIFASAASAESWTDLNGTRTIEARLIGLWQESVVLQLQDGRKVTVAMNNLNATSRIQAQKLARAKVLTRTTLVDELKGQAAEAAAPAPTPLPTPRPAPTYVPPTPGTDCVTQLRWAIDQSNAGHTRAYFDSLPMTYRADIGNLVKLASTKVDPAAWQSLITSIQKLGNVIVMRQRWIFSHPRVAALDANTSDVVQGFLLDAGGLVRTLADPDAMSLAKFSSMPFDQWVAERSDAMAPYMASLTNMPGMTAPTPTLETVSEKDGIAVIKFSLDGVSDTKSFTQVDGFWVPTEWATDWATNIETAKKSLDGIPAGSFLTGGQVAMVTGLIGANIDPIMQAQNEKDFHASMEPVFAQLSPLIAQIPSMLGARQRTGQYGQDGMSGYEDEMQMNMDMEMDMNMEMGMDSSTEDDMYMGMPMGSDESQN